MRLPLALALATWLAMPAHFALAWQMAGFDLMTGRGAR